MTKNRIGAYLCRYVPMHTHTNMKCMHAYFIYYKINDIIAATAAPDCHNQNGRDEKFHE